VRGQIAREPDRAADGFILGPRVLMSRAALDATGIVRPGSLITWRYRVQLAPGAGPEDVQALRVAATKPSRRRLEHPHPRPGGTRHRPLSRPADVPPDPGRPHRADRRRPGHRQCGQRLPQAQALHHRHPEMPRRLLTAGLPGLSHRGPGRRHVGIALALVLGAAAPFVVEGLFATSCRCRSRPGSTRARSASRSPSATS
jgi:hypothetical protein